MAFLCRATADRAVSVQPRETCGDVVGVWFGCDGLDRTNSVFSSSQTVLSLS